MCKKCSLILFGPPTSLRTVNFLMKVFKIRHSVYSLYHTTFWSWDRWKPMQLQNWLGIREAYKCNYNFSIVKIHCTIKSLNLHQILARHLYFYYTGHWVLLLYTFPISQRSTRSDYPFLFRRKTNSKIIVFSVFPTQTSDMNCQYDKWWWLLQK